jgi:nucleoid DNA-binding protein
MPGHELLAEVEWQLDFGMSPIHISEVLNKTPEAIKKAAERHNNHRVKRHFTSIAIEQRNKREGR